MEDCNIALRFDKSCDRRCYNLPTAASKEIAVILPGSEDQPQGDRDIILRKKDGSLMQIDQRHPFYVSLHYVLLFPTGQLGWHPRIEYKAGEMVPDAGELEPNDGENNEGQGQPSKKRKYITQTEYFSYRLHPRMGESNHIFRAGKLFQEYIVDAWALCEQARLLYVQTHQKELRADTYQGVVDALASDANATGNEIGQRTILPSSFIGGTRNMIQNCQDALPINRHFHGADLFITITANPNWPEVTRELLPGQTASDRPDLVVRVFHAKVAQLLKDLNEHGVMGRTVARVWTIEFQKRGLPHMHLIVFLDPAHKLRTPEDIDTLISAEFPDEHEMPELYELVKKFMVHNPCGTQNPQSPCMDGNKCSKSFPKPFRDQTTVSDDSYANLRRRNDGKQHIINGKEVDNRWVVPHSPWLIWKYRCHINVECITSVKAIKYIYKYVYKGHDRTTMEFGTCQDEVKQYLDARYVSSCEALWRIYHFRMHDEHPGVVRLQVHLPNQQLISWDENVAPNLQQVVAQAAEKDTTLTAYFKANDQIPEARNHLYQDFPVHFVWVRGKKKWKIRQQQTAIGRMFYAHPASGERFYLRTLLTAVKGATSFENLRTVNGETYATFQEACIAHGLLADDNEWKLCLQDAGLMQSGRQLRNLFVTILRDCSPSDPAALWLHFRTQICDDLRWALQHKNIRQNPTEEDVFDYGLYLIDKLLRSSSGNKGLEHWPTMPQPQQNWDLEVGNRLIREQRDYDAEEQTRLANERIPKLNEEQRKAFDEIVEAVNTKSGQTFFLHGPGGTGKTYIYNTLCYFLRGQHKIIICVASSGIAALLIIGGRTSHSCFKIPINIDELSSCLFGKNSDLAELIRLADLIVWDEAPMQHRHIHEAVDRTFRDVRGSDKPFGGLSVVFGGDFQQILPVIVKGSRAQIVNACMQRSTLWHSMKVLHLTQNMRLNVDDAQERDFAQWQIDIGHGRHTNESDDVSLPESFKCAENTVQSLIDTIYPGIDLLPHPEDHYFSERTILSSRNDDVDDLNHAILNRFPGEVKVFQSADSIEDNEGHGEDGILMYPVEYLNSINCSGLPLAKLALKIGCPIMVLRNINPGEGVCNGSRGILTRATSRVLEVRLLTGEHAGELMFIPWMGIIPNETQVPFKFRRVQFPVRLCFAMTINKSQGQSVNHVGIDARSAVFTHGQFYVAISRVTSVHNIKIIWDDQLPNPVTKNIVYPEVLLN
jgi:hypothetical protein